MWLKQNNILELIVTLSKPSKIRQPINLWNKTKKRWNHAF